MRVEIGRAPHNGGLCGAQRALRSWGQEQHEEKLYTSTHALALPHEGRHPKATTSKRRRFTTRTDVTYSELPRLRECLFLTGLARFRGLSLLFVWLPSSRGGFGSEGGPRLLAACLVR